MPDHSPARAPSPASAPHGRPPSPPVTVRSFGRSLAGRTTPVALTADVDRLDPVPGIARGSGCSYGDQAWCSGGRVVTAPDDVVVDGDHVEVGGGVVLRDLVARLWPLGWTLAVLPGSLAVTVGGAIAADVHGKNHPTAGSFGRLVARLDLVTPTGTHVLGPGDEAFHATTGGMGLTGVVRRARLALVAQPTAWADHETRPIRGASALREAMRSALGTHHHVAAWVDLAGPDVRGIVEATTVGVPAPNGTDAPVPGGPRIHVPPLPTAAITRATIRIGNAARFRRARATRVAVPVADALFPLEAVGGFPHLYGPDGFVQHQVVVPDGAEDLLDDLLGRYRDLPVVPALVVLKRLGPAGPGHLSFPRAGWTIAVDLPAGDRRLGRHLDAMDHDVAAVGGRVYLAKDATADPATVAAMHPRLDEWRSIADRLDPDHVVTSDMDRRLGLRRPARPAKPPGGGLPDTDQPSSEHRTTDGEHRDA